MQTLQNINKHINRQRAMNSTIRSVILAACCLLLNAATIPVDFNGSQASARPNENTNNGDRSRRLAVGDFARFNQLFDNAKISIPGTFEISERVGIVTLDMTMRNIICYDISIGDAAISHIRNSNQDIDVSVNVTQLDIKCDLSYEYDYGLLRGTGEAVVTTDNNSMSTKLGFASSNFELVPPSNSEVESCVTNIQITNIEFTGDFVSNIVEIFERFIRNTIETEIEKVACEELSSLGTSFITDMLGLAGDTLQQYEGDLGPSVTDPLHLEQTTEFPSSLVALDLLDTENTIGTWFNQALQEVDKLLTAVVPDPNGPTGTGQDLGINKMLRDNLLDENRALVVDVEQLPIDGVLFEGHDKLTETTITLQQVKLLGLDTMTLFNPLDRIGQYTLQTDMTWQQLTLQFDVSVDIKPSTKEDSMLQDATSEGIIETISIELGLENVNVSASLFLVVDQDALGAMKIGPLLKTDYIMPCLLSALHSVQLSGLHIDPQMVSVPTLAGFVSPGLDRIITDAAEAVFEMYKGALEDALPNIFQTSIREFVNREVFEGFLSDTEIFACPPVQEVDGYVDFRDLFFSPSEALAQGGAGNEPYGDLAYTAMGFLRDDLLALDGNGSLKLNSFLIEPLTKAQSGTIGTLQFPKDLISLTKTTFANKFIRSFVNRFEIGLSNLRLKNLDILVPPVSILQTTTSPHVLTNQLTMGPIDGHPLEITVGFKLLLEGENTSPLEMVNDVDISMSFGSAAFVGDILAKIDADKFLQFPLKDILLPQCWLATIPAPTLDDSGVRLASSDLTLAFQQVALTLSSLGMNVEFVNTTNLGTAAMTDILSKFSTSEGNGLLVERMNTFVQEILENDWLQTLLDRGLVNAPISCPHSSEFDESASPSTFPQITFPDLSNLTVDTMFYAAALIAESSFVVYMESERLKARESTNALAGQDTVSDLEPLIDWTNLDGRIGAIVDSAIQEVTRYLAAPQDESGKLGVNIMIQDWLLDSNSFLSWEFDDLSFDLPGIKISLTSVNISGLDSFTEFATWQPIAPQTILTNFTLDKIDVNLSVDVVDITTNEKRQGLTIGLSIANVSADVATFIAMSKDRLEMLELGSFMNIQNIIPCLLSSVDTIEITKIDLSIGELENPRIDGLMEESQASLDTFMTDVMEDYKAQILSTIPIIFDHTIRELLNGLAATYLSSGPCPLMAPPSDSAFIDFESFFDEGSNMYGNLPPLLKNLLDSELIALNNRTGQPKINEILIAPFTERQSGKEGSLLFSGDLFSGGTRVQVGGLDANVQLRASDARIENLDTVGSPLEILVPVLKKKHMLNNSASLGIEDRPLRFGARLLLSLMGDGKA